VSELSEIIFRVTCMKKTKRDTLRVENENKKLISVKQNCSHRQHI